MASIWDFLKKRRDDGSNDLEAVLTPEKPQNFLSQFLPEDEDKREAVARALIQGGAAAMMSGGPSTTPTNLLQVLGAGVAGGAKGYDDALESNLEAQKFGAANKINNVKLQNLQDSQNRTNAFVQKYGKPSANGYSIEALFALHQLQLENGDEESARATQKMIQSLQQEAAGKGMILGDKGYELAPGYGESLFDTEKAKGLGSAIGKNAEFTTDRKDFMFGQTDPEFRKYELEKAKSNSINVNTAPKDGEIFKAMDKERENAAGSQAGLRLVYEMKNSLPNAITGFGADYLLAGQKAIAALGGDASRVVDTETLKTNAMELAAKMKGELVGNQQISDSDMRFVQQVAAGDTKLDGGTIKRLVDVREKQLIGNIDRYNSRVNQLYPDTPENTTNRNYFGGVTVPENPHSKPTSPSGDASAKGDRLSGVVTVTTEEQFNALPKGTTYRIEGESGVWVK